MTEKARRPDDRHQEGCTVLLNTQDSSHLAGKRQYSQITRTPKFTPISQEQLATKVEGIYAGLVQTETECTDAVAKFNKDAQKACPHDESSKTQWTYLFELHRKLLDVHNDFLMATQHPSANPVLLGLAIKHSTSARMQKHGIYEFLKFLKHRRPDWQEHMLQFIYLAYRMISLLLETAPRFTYTWMEYLGGLADYLVAIEKDKEWDEVATDWDKKAAAHRRSVGQLYHHSVILKSPSLQKLYLYGRTSTSLVPLPNAEEPLGNLCPSVLTDEQALREGDESMEALVICFYERVILSEKTKIVDEAFNAALGTIKVQSEDKFATSGVYLAITNIAALLGLGSSDNIYRRLFDFTLSQEIPGSGTSRDQTSKSKSSSNPTYLEVNNSQLPVQVVLKFYYQSFNSIIQRTPHGDKVRGLLPYVHVMLVFIASLYTLRSRLHSNDNAHNTLDGLLILDDLLTSVSLDWPALAQFLNHVAQSFPDLISSHTESLEYKETFPSNGVPLPEDYMIHGQVWAQWYFAPDWFNKSEDDDSLHCLEDESKSEDRAARVLYLGMILARDASRLYYDSRTRQFSNVDGGGQ
jgi:hypothetical protein